MSNKKQRLSKHEIIESLFFEQQRDDTSYIWPEKIRQYVNREYEVLEGDTWRKKIYFMLFKLGWKEEWIAEGMDVSLKTAKRMKRLFRVKSGK